MNCLKLALTFQCNLAFHPRRVVVETHSSRSLMRKLRRTLTKHRTNFLDSFFRHLTYILTFKQRKCRKGVKHGFCLRFRRFRPYRRDGENADLN